MSRLQGNAKVLKMYRGNFRRIRVEIDLEEGQNLLDKVIYFTLKGSVSIDDDNAIQQSSVGNGIEIVEPASPTAILLIDLLPDSTKDLPDRVVTLIWDVQLELEANKPQTLESGFLHVYPQVTQKIGV